MDIYSLIYATGFVCLLIVIVTFMFRPYDYGANAGPVGKIEDDEPAESDDTKWRSVRVRPGLISCRRVANLTDQVFPSREAPELPLPNCTEADCHCHYVFYDDRRSGIDRRVDLGRLGEFLSSSDRDRRRRRGRRVGDMVPA